MENRFYVGQPVVYITGLVFPKNSIHVIKQIFSFPCGCFSFDVGTTSKSGRLTCADHHFGNGITTDVDHYHSESFMPLSEKTAESESFAEETLKQIEHEIIETYTVK